MAYFACAVDFHHTFPDDNAFSVVKKTPFGRYAMRPIVNVPNEDRATQHAQKFGKGRACGSGDSLADRPTDRETDPQTDILITVLLNRSRGRGNEVITVAAQVTSSRRSHDTLSERTVGDLQRGGGQLLSSRHPELRF